nr:PAS-domain containing protein [Rhodoferax sp.]
MPADAQISVSLLHDTIAGLYEGVSIFNAQLQLVVCNARAIVLSGIPADRVKPGVHLRDLLRMQVEAGEFGPCDPQAEVERRLDELKQSVRLTYERQRPDGRTVEVRHSPLPDGGFRTVYQEVARDPANRRASEMRALEKTNEALRIAAIAFEGQEGIIVTDANRVILRVNAAFTRITGFEASEVQDQHTELLRSGRYDESFFESIVDRIQQLGSWEGQMWSRHKLRHESLLSVTARGVSDTSGRVANYVITLIDVTDKHRQSEQHRLDEAAQRNALVREVHHRIKNNLHGITGLLREFAFNHPETAPVLNRAIGQVNSIATIHGLQGYNDANEVRLCGLICAIAAQVHEIWIAKVDVIFVPGWIDVALVETETVPLALVLNELVANAAKHSDRACTDVRIELSHNPTTSAVRVNIINHGHYHRALASDQAACLGLQLVDSLMPREGAHLQTLQLQGEVHTQLDLYPPVVSPPLFEITPHDKKHEP